MIELITDGACSGNPGPGGWAVLVIRNEIVEEYGGAEPHTTNNRMELQAAIEGLRRVPHDTPVRVTTDSQYLLNGITRWIRNWRLRGWKTSEGRPVENRDLWEELDQLAGSRTTWRAVRGHSGDPLNERADLIAHSYATGRIPPPATVSAALRVADAPATRYPSPIYLSLVDGRVMRHSSWEACRARVHGVSGARFKKCASAAEEQTVIASWGLDATALGSRDAHEAGA
ncbi:MAG TPA: ribonuclease HI [Roseiflexaceae bacterium]|nr:ribonuclease HI [Roseiflexaceae bacterium]HMP39731.1 ribonuclease HI [Roseiflexaceae bacterium]